MKGRFTSTFRFLGSLFVICLLFSQGLTSSNKYAPNPDTFNSSSEVMFPYGPQNGDAEITQEFSEYSIKFLFMDNNHDKVYVSKNGGHISFGLRPAYPQGNKLPYSHPLTEDPPMAAVFFSDADHRTKENDPTDKASKVYGRLLESTNEGHKTMLDQLGQEIRKNAVTNLSSFWPTHAIIVTWHSMRYRGCYKQSHRCDRNTFQAAIVTDEKLTYAIYNYKELNWVGGSDTSCVNPDDPECFPAQVGFNAGYGRLFAELPGSNTRGVLDLAREQGSRTVGRYIYKVSHTIVHRDGCTSFGSQQPVAVYPSSASMLGGEEIYAAGPCLSDPNVKVTCQFQLFVVQQYTQEVEARVLDSGRVACPVPALVPVGDDVYLMVKEASRPDYLHRTHIKIEAPNRKRRQVKLHDYHTKWLARNPDELTLTWRPELLHRGWLDSDNYDGQTRIFAQGSPLKVDIVLYGFREWIIQDRSRGPQREWKRLAVLVADQDNNGQFTFKPSEHRCIDSENWQCEDWQIGAIKIQVAGVQVHQATRGLMSDIIPLGWYVEDVMVKKHGNTWPETLCRAWQEQDNGDWRSELPTCPCVEKQAYTDQGQFIVGAECDMNSTDPVPCPLSPDATVCYVSATPTKHFAGSRCCYDKAGFLISSGDRRGGSYSARVHELGKKPYTQENSVPVLSNWKVDKLPYIWCCLWSDDPALCMEKYEPKRRTPDCSKRQEAGSAFAFGDPHFITFDGTPYTFNGFAEYWLIKTRNTASYNAFALQARMANSMGSVPSDLNATVITAVALQQTEIFWSASAPKVTMFLRPPLALDRIAVYVNGEYQEFYSVSEKTWRDTDRFLTIIRESPVRMNSNFTVLTDSGIYVNVAEKAGVLQIRTTLPHTYYNKTTGLFGLWDGDSANDLTSRDGQVTVSPSNPQDVHRKFGNTWQVSKEESIFHYYGAMDWSYYAKNSDTFVPIFTPEPAGGVTKEMVDRKCGHDTFCAFDYMTTASEGIAESSLEAQSWAAECRNMSAPVAACPYLLVEMSTRPEGTNSLAGSTVSLTGCVSGYTLQGPQTFRCVQNGESVEWSPSPQQAKCKANSEIAKEKQTLAVAISVPIAILVVAAMVALIVLLMFTRRRKEQQKSPAEKMNLPRQQPPVNPEPNPALCTDSGVDLSQSRISLASRGSNHSSNSIVLTQNIVAQRPPRPVKTRSNIDHPDGDNADAFIHPQSNNKLPDPHPYAYINPDFKPTHYPYRGPQQQPAASGLRPQSTVSYYGAESGARDRGEDSRSLDGDISPYPQQGQGIQRSQGYNNMAVVGDEDRARSPYPYRGSRENLAQDGAPRAPYPYKGSQENLAQNPAGPRPPYPYQGSQEHLAAPKNDTFV